MLLKMVNDSTGESTFEKRGGQSVARTSAREKKERASASLD